MPLLLPSLSLYLITRFLSCLTPFTDIITIYNSNSIYPLFYK